MWGFFGLGEGIDARLLSELATESGGMFSQIFDGTGLITAIVEFLATARTVAGRDGFFTLRTKTAADLSKALLVKGGCPTRAVPNAFGGVDLEVGGTVLSLSAWESPPAACPTGTQYTPSIPPCSPSFLSQVRVGLVTYGTPRHCVVSLDPAFASAGGAASGSALPSLLLSPDHLEVGFSFRRPPSGSDFVTAQPAISPPAVDPAFVAGQLHRAEGIALLRDVASTGDVAASREAVRSFVSRVEASACPSPPILADIKGEVALSVAKDGLTWTVPNALTLAFAHENEVVPHYKARGCYAYGGSALRRAAQARIDAAFNAFVKRCPLVPSLAPGRAQAIDPLVFIQFANNASGECFSGDARVTLADGVTDKPMRDLVPGVDKVMTYDEASGREAGPADVRCLTFGKEVLTTRLVGSALFITPWHPVLRVRLPLADSGSAATEEAVPVAEAEAEAGPVVGPRWTCAAKEHALLAGEEEPPEVRRETVFNLLLARGAPSGVVRVGGRLTCGLGHGLLGDGVAHPFFGSYDAVEASLGVSATWGVGVVELAWATRDEATGLVSGFVVVEPAAEGAGITAAGRRRACCGSSLLAGDGGAPRLLVL